MGITWQGWASPCWAPPSAWASCSSQYVRAPELDFLTLPGPYMLRRSSPFLVLGMLAVVASCNNLTGVGPSSGTPVGIVLMDARTKGAGYTTYPRVNFYSVGSATFVFSNVNSDSCVSSTYDTTAVPANTATQIGAGAYMIAAVPADTDSLYKAATGDLTYHSNHIAGLPFTPGDSVFFNIAGDLAGFPQMQAYARTAEP